MKKIISLLLAGIIVLSLAACGGGKKGTDNSTSVNDSKELLTGIWSSYDDDEKFSAIGGDANNAVDDAPGTYSPDDAAALESVFGLPQEMAEQIDDAASLMHMMNANTFTCIAMRVKDSDKVDTVSQAIEESVMNRQWMCGFPDKLVVMDIGEYVISVFGNEELVDSFKAKTEATYENTNVAYEEPIL